LPKGSLDFDLSSIGALLTVAIVAIAAFSIFSLANQTFSFQRSIRSSGGITAEEGLGINRRFKGKSQITGIERPTMLIKSWLLKML
jgi:hypothetical protein